MNIFLEKPGKPGTPDYADIKDGKIPLKWVKPEDDGGSPIFNYVLEYRIEGAFKWKRITEETISDLKYAAKGLNVDDLYEFRVAAENKAGVGPYSDPSEPVKAKEPIGEALMLF